jgi:heat-inducible transcriptional repressor
MFNINGCSLIVAPYEKNHYRGAVGVVGPLHMDYRRIIPIIDTMAKLLERMHL